MLLWSGVTTATAQDSPRGILGLGDAAVTGFSGVRPPAAPLPPQVNPLDKIFIDIDGPSLRVIDLNNPGGPPRGQVMTAPKPFTISARQIGQVFAVAHDDATPPNIYVAATSAYGLPIVAAQPDADGTLRRLRRGEPGARFMPGLFGAAAAGGGPGSIWKIDGRTGAVSPFANIPNSGAGLGDIAFDAAHRQFFVSDRSSGLIYRVGLDGALRDTFDHGTAGRAAVGLAPVPDQPQSRLNIQSPAFDPGNPQSWNYPAPARRTFGLAVRQLRLFYALAEGPQVWSVALNPDGSFGSNVTWELSVPAAAKLTEIASILFDAGGQIYLAERGAPTGAYDFMALAESGENRVLRFRARRPGDPPSAGNWHPTAEEYAIGFPSEFRNGNGGIAIGYDYSPDGTINRAACGGMLWSTGEQLRNERALAQRLQPGGPLIVDGLQANAIDLVRPRNVPPFESYYVDYDDRFDSTASRGHLGDVDIWQVCQAVALAPPPAIAPVSAPLLAPQFPVRSAPPAESSECQHGETQICCRAHVGEPNSLAVTCIPPPPGTNVCPGNSTQVCCTRNANGVCVPRPPSPPPPSSPPSPPAPSAPPSEGKPPPVPPPSDGGAPPQLPHAPDKPEIPSGPLVPNRPPIIPPVRADCTLTERLLGRCSAPNKSLCQAAGDMCCAPFSGIVMCTPTATADGCPNGSVCCSEADRNSGNCHVPPPSPPLANNLCPSTWQKTGMRIGKTDTCCNLTDHSAYFCSPIPSSGCPAGSSQSGDVCCERKPGADSLCAPPASSQPPSPTATEGDYACGGLVWVPIIGFICEVVTSSLPSTDPYCVSDDECPGGTYCSQGTCYPKPEATSNKAPTSTAACQPPSILVNGACCSPEAVAAGVCAAPPPQSNRCPAGLFPSNDGKTCCTGEEITNETCGVPPAPKKKPRKKPAQKPAPVPNSSPQINPGFSIQIGPGGGFPGRGGGGSRRGGGGGPKLSPKPSPKPSIPN